MTSEITIVSGIPRSGTSLMMKMLDAGGMPIVTDHIRKADIDNPEGYYEFEKVKKIRQDISWLKDTRGKAFKMVSMLLLDLPPGETYKIIFMERTLTEVIASQNRMLERKKIPSDSNDSDTAHMFEIHLKKVRQWIASQKNISFISINYNKLISSPDDEIARVAEFLGVPLDKNKMARAVNPDLYRNRAG